MVLRLRISNRFVGSGVEWNLAVVRFLVFLAALGVVFAMVFEGPSG